MRKTLIITSLSLCATLAVPGREGAKRSYPIVDTGQVRAYNATTEITFPKRGADFYGQDAMYQTNKPAYRDNGNGTITDLVTALTWQQDPGPKKTLKDALIQAKSCRLGGRNDWRVPTIKELYSLILFSGTDPDPMSDSSANLKPFIDTRYFNFQYGDPSKGERIIDSQYGSSTNYVSTTMRGDATLFGVNFADGRIKGYGLSSPRTGREKTFYFMYVRGNTRYGKNDFVDNTDGTVADRATGLTWMKVDSAKLKAGPSKTGGMTWQHALAWAETLTYAGHSDWRLPDIKELQSIVDYTRSPKTSKSPAIAPLFQLTPINDEGGNTNYGFYWSSSTHCGTFQGAAADYIAFGDALGWMTDRRTGEKTLMDVHGAGSQRSDPKDGNPKQFPYGRGPQGDVIRIYNFVLCVRGGNAQPVSSGPRVTMKSSGQRSGNQPPARPSFVNRLDKNHDGKISKDEFDGPKRHFKTLDKNSDGFLSEDEAPNGPPPKRN